MLQIQDVAALLICYRRPENVKEILKQISNSGITKIYVALDGFKDETGRNDYLLIKEIVNEFAANFSGQVHTRFLKENLGCSVSVITACNWVFSQEEYHRSKEGRDSASFQVREENPTASTHLFSGINLLE